MKKIIMVLTLLMFSFHAKSEALFKSFESSDKVSPCYISIEGENLTIRFSGNTTFGYVTDKLSQALGRPMALQALLTNHNTSTRDTIFTYKLSQFKGIKYTASNNSTDSWLQIFSPDGRVNIIEHRGKDLRVFAQKKSSMVEKQSFMRKYAIKAFYGAIGNRGVHEAIVLEKDFSVRVVKVLNSQKKFRAYITDIISPLYGELNFDNITQDFSCRGILSH